MAEYLTASPPRRKTIIQEARFPKVSVVAQYQKARESLVEFLSDGTRSLNHFARATEYLSRREARPDATEWLKRDSRFSNEAIEVFQRAYNKLGFPKIACEQLHGRHGALVFGPTRVSVDLDVVTRRRNMKGRDHIGGVVLVFSKGEPLNRKRIERCKVLAGLCYTFCSTFLKDFGDIDRTLCLAVDVFGQLAYKPPGTFAVKLKHVEESCEEIGARWRTVAPPADYDGPEPV